MIDQPVRLGLVGYGAWGRCHANAIAKSSIAELAMIADCDSAARRHARQQHPNVPAVADYEQLLEDENIELVDIVVPNDLHHQVGVASLRAQKHLLLEKPMCLELEQCDELLDLARETSRQIIMVHQFRLSSLWGLIKQYIDAGKIGSPLYALVELSRNPYRLGAGGWRYDLRRVGDWILEEPIHFFDLARWYLEDTGEPQTLYAAANSRRQDHPELQDNCSAIVHFAGGAYAVISQTLAAFEHHHTVKITGTHGALWAAWSGAMDRTQHPRFFLKVFAGENVEEVDISRTAGELFELEDQIDASAAALRGGTQPMCATGADGKWAVAMCLATQDSIKSGRPAAIRCS